MSIIFLTLMLIEYFYLEPNPLLQLRIIRIGKKVYLVLEIRKPKEEFPHIYKKVRIW